MAAATPAWRTTCTATRSSSTISDCNHLSGSIYFQKSTDNGATWSRPRLAVAPLYKGGLTDKDWLEIDNNRTSPHVGTMYISTTELSKGLIEIDHRRLPVHRRRPHLERPPGSRP